MTTATLSYSKKQIRQKRPRLTGWASYNDPALDGKFLRYAERVAREVGVVDAVREFDAAAAAAGLPNAPRIVAATLLERSNVVLRDVEAWEADFLAFSADRRAKEAKQYPQALLDLWTANERAVGGGSGSGAAPAGADAAPAAAGEESAASAGAAAAGAASAAGSDGKAAKGGKAKGAASAPAKGAPATTGPSASGAAPAASSSPRASSPPSSAALAPAGLEGFYERGSAMSAGGGASEAVGLQATARVTAADQIGDRRSLDRAYSQRLVLVVRDRATGEWGLPGSDRLEGEPMQQAAERWMRACFSAGAPAAEQPNLWYVGQTPVGHWLRVYPREMQVERGCYGEKVFFYRAEILSGRFRLPKTPASSPYDDFMWLSRDETEGVFPRPFYKYAYQMIGAGAGEEAERSAAWRKSLEKEDAPVANAVARRARRVQRGSARGLRLRVIATTADAELAASALSSKERNARVKATVDRFHERVRESRAISATLRKGLRTLPAVELLRARLASASASASAPAGVS
jgi:hypothetical protein